MIRYQLNDEGITFFVDDIMVFDCTVERIQHDPFTAIKAMQMIDNHWRKKTKILALKGGLIDETNESEYGQG